MTITPIDLPTWQTRVQILGEGGAVTDIVVPRPRTTTLKEDEAVNATIRTLAVAGLPDVDIAKKPNAGGSRTGRGGSWNAMSVRTVRRRLGIQRSPTAAALVSADGLYSTRGVAERFGVSMSTVTWWSRVGLLQPEKVGTRGRSAWYVLDDESVRYIEQHRQQHATTRHSPAVLKGDAP